MIAAFPPKTLGIDFGLRRIGLAVTRASLVEPLFVITWDGKNLTPVLEQIKAVVIDETIKQIIVGVSEGSMADQSRTFGDTLHDFAKLPVKYVDETLTSQLVEHKIKHLRKKQRSGALDHFAAAEILESYLDSYDYD